MLSWLFSKRPPEENWRFTFQYDEDVKVSAKRNAELQESIDFLSVLVRDFGFKKVDDFSDGWPSTARICKNTGTDTLWVELHIDIGGSKYDRLLMPKFDINWQLRAGDWHNNSISKAATRISKELDEEIVV